MRPSAPWWRRALRNRADDHHMVALLHALVHGHRPRLNWRISPVRGAGLPRYEHSGGTNMTRINQLHKRRFETHCAGRTVRRLSARRSSSVRPPHTPAVIPFSKANLRQASITGQRLHTALASSIWTSAGPELPIGKNSSGSSRRHAAWSAQSMALTAEGTSGRPRTGNGDAAAAAARIVPALRPALAAPFEFFLPILIFTGMVVRNARVMTVVPAGARRGCRCQSRPPSTP